MAPIFGIELNTSVLKDAPYCSQIEALFDKVLQDCSNLNKCVIWDLFKVRLKVKEFSLKYSQRNAQLQKDIIDKLENDISVLNRALEQKNSVLLNSKREQLKKELVNTLSITAIGAQIRARAQYVEKCEMSTSCFLKLEKHR